MQGLEPGRRSQAHPEVTQGDVYGRASGVSGRANASLLQDRLRERMTRGWRGAAGG